MNRGNILWGIVLIAVGALFLADTLSGGRVDAGALVGQWWPLLIVLVGVAILLEAAWPSRREAGELSLPLQGASQANVRIEVGAGRLAIGPAAPGHVVDGTFEGGVRHDVSRDGAVRLRLDPQGWWPGAGWRGYAWRVGVTREVPLALWVQCGASTNDLDLGDLRLADLHLETGASETRILLPRAAGATTMRIGAGAATVRISVPQGVAIRMTTTMALGHASVDTRRFPPSGTGYASPDWTTATNRVDIAFEGGLGSLFVE